MKAICDKENNVCLSEGDMHKKLPIHDPRHDLDNDSIKILLCCPVIHENVGVLELS